MTHMGPVFGHFAEGCPSDFSAMTESDTGETDTVETDTVETDTVETDAGETDAGETDALESDIVEICLLHHRRIQSPAKGFDASSRLLISLGLSCKFAEARRAGSCSTFRAEAMGAVTVGCWRSHANATVAIGTPWA